MNEAVWLKTDNPKELLDFVAGNFWVQSVGWLLSPRREQARQRKLRLYLCACVRRCFDKLGQRARAALEVAERYADGLVGDADLDAARKAAALKAVGGEIRWVQEQNEWKRTEYEWDHNGWYAARAAARTIRSKEISGVFQLIRSRLGKGWKSEAALVRCLFDNPFRPPPAIDLTLLAWDNGTIKLLAEAAYENRLMPSGQLDPVRLGVLADALEEAGADAALLEHLRGPGPHVRGCQVVDRLTGRE
jgi:hypothetical protein